MPRKSAASLTVAAPDLGRRPAPPRDLSDRQRAVWMQIVSAKAADWFAPDTLPMLVALCAHVESFELIEREFRGLDKLTDADRLAWFGQLAKLRDRESRAIATLSTKLRLTQQSRYTPGRAATNSKAAGPRPWEVQRTRLKEAM